MYYRYEARNKEGQFVGIFQILNPSERRYINRFLREPKWYEKNSTVESRCWFTEEGYAKYHEVLDAIISEKGNLEVRIIQKERLSNIACKGKIQCIELVI